MDDQEIKVITKKGKEKLLPSLPLNCQPLSHQVAGHFYGKGKSKLGLLQTDDGFILKPVQPPPRGENEHNFYKQIFLSDEDKINEDEFDLRDFLPTYHGAYIHDNTTYIKMDNLAHGMKYPVIIDLKMGRITYDPDTPIEDVPRQMLTYPAREKVGFQLEGMRVFNRKELSFTRFDRTFGRSLSKDQVAHALGLFYQFHELKPQTWAIKQTLDQLEAIRHWFMKQTTYHFYKSSLIIIYDANANQAGSTVDNQVKVFMADFDHVFPANDTINENYLYGIERLIEYLKLLLDSTYKFKDIRTIVSNPEEVSQKTPIVTESHITLL